MLHRWDRRAAGDKVAQIRRIPNASARPLGERIFPGVSGPPATPATPPIRYEIRRSYTPLGQPESVHLVSAEDEALSLDHKVGYSWNPRNQLASVKSLAGEFNYEYDKANPALLAKMTGPVHEVETTYEPHRNLIAGVTNFAKRGGAGSTLPADGGGTVLSSYAYSNDLLGRRETISQGGEAFALLKLGDTKIDVAYNDRSEVVGAVYKTGNETRQQFRYDYDGIGNRRSVASEVSSRNSEIRREETRYTTNALNQYQEISADQRRFDDDKEGGLGRPSPASPPIAVHPSYDLDGNLAEDAKNRYTWDSENRLTRVEAKTGDSRIDYVYDHQSRRTVRREYQRDSKESDFQLVNSVFYLYDGWNLLAEVTSTPENPIPAPDSQLLTPADEVHYHTWGRDLSGTLQGAGGVGGLLAATELGRNAEDSRSLSPASRFFLYDANGNVSQLLDGAGEITAAYSYDPFGNVTEMAGPEAKENPWRFSTKPLDAATGWLYYGYRWYDAELGRWVNRDPIEESGGVNLYGFVENDALNRFDKFGLITIPWAPIGIGVGVYYSLGVTIQP